MAPSVNRWILLLANSKCGSEISIFVVAAAATTIITIIIIILT